MAVGFPKLVLSSGRPDRTHQHVHDEQFGPGITIFGYPLFGREIWGLRAWIPLGVALAVAYLIRSSVRPVEVIAARVNEAWSLLTFGILGLMPLMILSSFDEIEASITLPTMVLTLLLFSCGAYVYLRRSGFGARVRTLAVVASASALIAAIPPAIYWHPSKGAWSKSTLSAGLMVAMLMAPCSIPWLRRLGTSRSLGESV